jgi:hypothetical protein
LKQTYKNKLNVPIAHHIFPGKYCEAIKLHFFVESSHRLPNLDLQHNGLELTCALRFVSARRITAFYLLLTARTAARQVERIVSCFD